MDSQTVRVVFGLLMTGTAMLFALPQFLRSRRGLVEGVSLPAITNVLASCVAWVVFALYLRDPWVLLTSVVALPSLIATTMVLLRQGADRSGILSTYVWAALLTLSLVGLIWTPVPAGFLVGIGILWYVGPAVWTAWTSADVSGVAAGAWVITLVDALIWGAYAVVADLPSFLLYSAIALAGSLAMLLRLALAGRGFALNSRSAHQPRPR